MLRLLNDPGFIKNIGDRNVRTVEAAREYIEEKFIRQGYEKMGFGPFLVETSLAKQPLGICSIVKRDSLEDIDIGYAFLPEHTGQGFALEASLEVMSYIKNTLKLKRIVAITNPDNTKSVILLQRLGLKFEKDLTLPEGQSKLFGLDFDQNK